jgi:hypothetical protein
MAKNAIRMRASFADTRGSSLDEQQQQQQHVVSSEFLRRYYPLRKKSADNMFQEAICNIDCHRFDNLVLKLVQVRLFGPVLLVSSAVLNSEHHSRMLERFVSSEGSLQFKPKWLQHCPLTGFERLIWKSTIKMSTVQLAHELQEEDMLQGFAIEFERSTRPLDFIASDENIVGILQELRAQGRPIPPDSCFCAGRSLAELEAAYATNAGFMQRTVVRSMKVQHSVAMTNEQEQRKERQGAQRGPR